MKDAIPPSTIGKGSFTSNSSELINNFLNNI